MNSNGYPEVEYIADQRAPSMLSTVLVYILIIMIIIGRFLQSKNMSLNA